MFIANAKKHEYKNNNRFILFLIGLIIQAQMKLNQYYNLIFFMMQFHTIKASSLKLLLNVFQALFHG